MLETKLGRLTFIRQIYRRLLNRGRTYAAFERKKIFPIVQSLAKNNSQILDPMSGYGTLMSYCSELGIDSFSVEMNPPSYYWQVLVNPNNNLILTEFVNSIRRKKSLPKQP